MASMKGSLTWVVLLLALVLVAPAYAVSGGIKLVGCGWVTGDALSCGNNAVYQCNLENNYFYQLNNTNITSFYLRVNDGIDVFPTGSKSYAFSLYSGSPAFGVWRAYVPVGYYNNATAKAIDVVESHFPSTDACSFQNLASPNSGMAGCEYLSPNPVQSYVSNCQCTAVELTVPLSNNTCRTTHSYAGCGREGLTDYSTSAYCNFCNTTWVTHYSSCVFDRYTVDGLPEGTAVKTYEPSSGDACYYRSGATPDDTVHPVDDGVSVVCRADGWFSGGKDWEMSRQERSTPWMVGHADLGRAGTFAVDVFGRAVPLLSGVFGGSQGLVVFNDTGTMYVLDATVQSVLFSSAVPGAQFFSDASIWGQDLRDNGGVKQFNNGSSTGVAFIYYNVTDLEYYFKALKYTGSGFADNYTFSISDLSGNDAFGSGVTCAETMCYFVGNDNKLYMVNVVGGSVTSANPNTGTIVQTSSRITPVVLSRSGLKRIVAWVGTNDFLLPSFMACDTSGAFCNVGPVAFMNDFSLMNASHLIVVKNIPSSSQNTYDVALSVLRDAGGSPVASVYTNSLTGSFSGNSVTGVAWGLSHLTNVDSAGGGVVDCVGDPARASCGVGGFAVSTHWALGTGGGGSPASGVSPLDHSAVYNNKVGIESSSLFPVQNAGIACTKGVCFAGKRHSFPEVWTDQGTRDWTNIPLPSYVNTASGQVISVGAYLGNAYVLYANSTSGGGKWDFFAMKYSPSSSSWTFLGRVASNDTYSAASGVQPLEALTCWEYSGGGCSIGMYSGASVQGSSVAGSPLNDRSGYLLIGDAGIQREFVDSGTCVPTTPRIIAKVGGNVVFSEADAGVASNSIWKVTGGAVTARSCALVDGALGSKVGPFVTADNEYAYVNFPDWLSGAYSVSNETDLSFSVGTTSNGLGNRWLNGNWSTAPVYQATAYLKTMSASSVATGILNKKVYVGNGIVDGVGCQATPYVESAVALQSRGFKGSDGVSQVEFAMDMSFAGPFSCSSRGRTILMQFNMQTGLNWPYLVSVPNATLFPGDASNPDTYGSTCGGLSTGAGIGCVPGILPGLAVSTRYLGVDSSNYGYRLVPLDELLVGEGYIYYAASGSVPVPDPVGPYQDVSCFGVAGSGPNLYRAARVTIPTSVCQNSIVSVDFDNDGVDEVLTQKGLYRYSNNMKIWYDSSLDDETATVIVSDLNYDTYADVGVVTDTVVRTLLSRNVLSAAYERGSVTATRTLCKNIGGTIYAGVEGASVNDPQDTKYTAVFNRNGVVVRTKSAVGTIGDALSYTPVISGLYQVTLTISDPTVGTLALLSCYVNVTVPVSPEELAPAKSCSLGEGGEFNYVVPVSTYGFRSSGSASLTGTRINLKSSSSSQYTSVSKRGLACTESQVNVTVKLNSTLDARWSFVVYGEASDASRTLQETQLGSLSFDGTDVKGQSTYDVASTKVGEKTKEDVEYSIIINKETKNVTIFVHGVAKATLPMFTGVASELSGARIGDVTGFALYVYGGSAYVDYVRITVSGATVSGVVGKEDVLRECVTQGERDFAVHPVGSFNQSYYPHVVQWCASTNKVGGKCLVAQLAYAAALYPNCYQEAFNYCVAVGLPNDADYCVKDGDGNCASSETTLNGAAICTVALGAGVSTKSIFAPLAGVALNLLESSWPLLVIVVFVLIMIAVARRRG